METCGTAFIGGTEISSAQVACIAVDQTAIFFLNMSSFVGHGLMNGAVAP